MAYTKYSLTPANNNAAPPDGAPEGMLPSAVNDTMRDMMSQIRDCGDGIRGGTYTMTAPVITGGSINGATVGASTASTGAFTTLFYTGTLTGGTGVVNLGSGQFYKDASGNLGLGTTSPTVYAANDKVLQIDSGANGGAIRISNTTTGANGGFLNYQLGLNSYLYNTSAGFLAFGTSNSESMRIDSSGNLLVGTTSTTGRLSIVTQGNTSGTFGVYVKNSSSTDMFLVRNDGGLCTGVASASPYNNTSAAAANCGVASDGYLFRSTSSIKYKTDVQDATHGLAEVLKLRPVTYKGKNDGETVFGDLIAEEVDEAGLKEFVQYADDGTPDALAYGQMVSLAFKAIQEQQVMIEELKAKVAALEAA